MLEFYRYIRKNFIFFWALSMIFSGNIFLTNGPLKKPRNNVLFWRYIMLYCMSFYQNKISGDFKNIHLHENEKYEQNSSFWLELQVMQICRNFWCGQYLKVSAETKESQRVTTTFIAKVLLSNTTPFPTVLRRLKIPVPIDLIFSLSSYWGMIFQEKIPELIFTNFQMLE